MKRAMHLAFQIRPVADWLKVRSAALEAIVVFAYFGWLAVTIGRFAAIRPLWYDELFTLHLARIASPLELLSHLAAGVDLNPPLLYLATRASILLFGEAEWAIRLPSLLGMLLGCGCLYAFLRRRGGAALALLAVAASVASIKVWVYFLDARPYGLAFGFAGLSLYCWQRAGEGGPRRGWLFGLALAAILGTSTHYYFAVTLAAIGYAEVLRWISIRRLDAVPSLALACGGLTLLAWRPLWSAPARDYAAGFWAKVHFNYHGVQGTFAEFAEPSLAIPVLLALAVAVLVRRPGPADTIRFHEAIALAALAASPLLGVYLGATLTGGFYYRYVLPAALGLGAIFAIVIHRAASGSPLAASLAFLAFAYTGLPFHARSAADYLRAEATELASLSSFLEANAGDDAVVLESHSTFGRVWHYHGGHRFEPLFIADAELAFQYEKVDTTDRALALLKRVTPVPAVTPMELLTQIKAGKAIFYYGPGKAWGYNDLKSRGVRFEKMAERPGGTLYRLCKD